jgi:hypothetical protein
MLSVLASSVIDCCVGARVGSNQRLSSASLLNTLGIVCRSGTTCLPADLSLVQSTFN